MTSYNHSLPSRRSVLKGAAALVALLSTTSLTGSAFAQGEDRTDFAFDFEAFSARLQAMAAGPFEPVVATIPDSFKGFDYDSYRLIQFRPDHGKWVDLDLGYQVQAFHLGWLYNEPVKLFEIDGGNARPLEFTAAAFQYHDKEVEAAAAAADPFPGIAGFRVNHPINDPAVFDELMSFVGASYFRVLGRDNIYGLSARGAVVNSWVDLPEEFPRFTEFYLERPVAGQPLTLYAALDSASLTGAYRFVVTPASDTVQETVVEVTARLFFRTDIQELGVAPLTSMFLYAETNRASFDDYRPQVHDSNGLLIERQSGEVMWRPLNNAGDLGNSYFWEANPRAFGLYQRGRNFETYQDAEAHYERRPSARVEPIGDWGQGSIRLIEIPAKLEADDNIVAFWIPSEPALAGEAREFQYRMIWGNLDPDPNGIAYVEETRGGKGGVSGIAGQANLRKFVVDFKGGELNTLPQGTPLDILANVTGGLLRNSTLSRNEANGVWRLVLDVEHDGETPIEMKAYLIGLGRKLTETWLYQWRPAA